MKRRRAEGVARCPVDHELEIDVMVSKVHEVERLEHRVIFAGDHSGILRTQAKGDEGADVPEHGVLHLGFQLKEMLVREHQADMELTQLRDHVRH